MTLADRLRKEGIKEGKQEGIREGKRQTLLNMANRLLKKRFGILPTEFTDSLQSLDTETLEIIIDDIFVYESLDDLDKFMG